MRLCAIAENRKLWKTHHVPHQCIHCHSRAHAFCIGSHQPWRYRSCLKWRQHFHAFSTCFSENEARCLRISLLRYIVGLYSRNLQKRIVIHSAPHSFPRSSQDPLPVKFSAQESKGVLPDESAVHISDQSGSWISPKGRAERMPPKNVQKFKTSGFVEQTNINKWE